MVGPNSWNYFDKKLVSSFSAAQSIREISPDVIHIKLFNANIPNYEAQEILELQKNFRLWTHMDEIESQLNKKIIPATHIAQLELNLSGENAKENLTILDIIGKKKRKK